MRIDIKETKEEEPNELEHVMRCLIEIRKAEKEVMRRYGFMTYRAWKEAQELVAPAIPERGIELDGFKMYKVEKPIYAISGGKSIGSTTKIKLSEN